MDYLNCDDSPHIKSLIHRSILRRRSKEERLIDLEEKCHELSQSNPNESELKDRFLPKDFADDDRCCYSQLVDWKLSPSTIEAPRCYCTACVNINSKLCPGNCRRFNCLATASRYLHSFEPTYVNASLSKCNQIKSSYLPKFTPYFDIQIKCFDLGQPATELLKQTQTNGHVSGQEHPHSDQGMRSMLKNVEQEHCQRLRHGLSYSDLNFPDAGEGSQTQKWRENFAGLGCRTDRPLSIIAIDSLLFPAFTENLGIDVFNETHATVAMIIEPQNETIYVLNERLRHLKQPQSISKQNLYRFIRDFDEQKLNRYVRSKSPDRISSRQNCQSQRNADGTQVVCVPEISAHSFAEVVLDTNKDVVLMHYTPWCGFCSSVAHTYLTVARFFADIPQVTFTRINGDANELPFEYSVDRYPAIAFYSAGRKTDHVLYPANMPITTTGLIQFVLANSADRVKWQAALKFCDRDCLQRNLLDYGAKQTQLDRQLVSLRDKLRHCPTHLNALIRKQLAKGRQAYYAVATLKDMILNKLRQNSPEKTLQTLHDQLQQDMMHIVNQEQLTSDVSNDELESSSKLQFQTAKMSAKKVKLPSRIKSKKDEL
jgi:thiol-disulfide isomerase/thioredoxin